MLITLLIGLIRKKNYLLVLREVRLTIYTEKQIDQQVRLMMLVYIYI